MSKMSCEGEFFVHRDHSLEGLFGKFLKLRQDELMSVKKFILCLFRFHLPISFLTDANDR